MENFTSNSNLEKLIKELSQGREMASQLQNHLNVSSSSRENSEYLLHKIIYSYDQAISMIKNSHPGGSGSGGAGTSREALARNVLLPTNQDSPRSPASDDSDNQDFKDHASRKRNDSTKWTQKVKVSPEIGIDGQLDDGYYWRKYGQKHILGAKYPRGYYRCSHRHGQGCWATKQVQRSDEDPNVFDITYRRQHTCDTRASRSNVHNPPVALPGPQNMDPTPLPQYSHEPSFNIQTSLGLEVITQGLGHNENPFGFPSSPTINPQNNNIFIDCDNILGNYSTNILSPASSGSNIFTIPTDVTNEHYFDTLESELSPIVAGIASTTTSSSVGTHFPFGSYEFGSDFSLDNHGYFP